jgi:hypothetical protein
MDDLNAAAGGDEVISISRFVAATDLLETYLGTLPANDFSLAAGEGYRVQVSETFTYAISGTHDEDLDIDLLAQGANSNSGTSDYCPPYSRVTDSASEFKDEIGASFSNISRFVIASDMLLTYDGTNPANDFDFNSGESYRVQVSGDVDLTPDVYDIAVDVEIEGQRPAPCRVLDGATLAIHNGNSEDYLHVKWHGGDPEREEPPDADGPYTNLVFLPTTGKSGCVSTGTCKAATCPGGNDPDGCEYIDCETCGCEITDGMKGVCSGALDYTRCDDDSDCGTGRTCTLLDIVAPQTWSHTSCNLVSCSQNPAHPYCPSINPNELDTNCCDQQFQAGSFVNCDDPSVVKCLELVPGWEFFISGVSDDGTNWIDLSDRGIVPDSIAETSCCDFVCVDPSDPSSSSCDPCNSSACGAGETCTSRCDGECQDSSIPCTSIADCLGSETDTCVRWCDDG